ncbi:TIGR02186 family protein [Devosia salina]|uniref:TIGR02186 family protein n=1 Tax=Devosia salina TaxID=2860336 RepID=A0ABX8WJB0_9HYPH|nr:TIGR02186 family protein [Devosia salina]
MRASLAVGQFPVLYGLACVVLALFIGWIGGVVFKR